MAQDSLQDKNPFELLGLQGDEDLAAIRKAFLKIAAQYHPDRLRSKSPQEREKGLAYFLEAKKAFELLSLPDKRREWVERLARAKAAAPSPAAPSPVPASAAPPTPPPASGPPPRLPSSAGGAALQIHKLGMIALESRDYGKALELFSKASKLAPTPRNQSMELVCRGHQFLSTRFFDKAKESFDRALELSPDCREARTGLELLDKQRQSNRYRR
jgi:curved DNA-binding protein CbpA